MSIPPASSTPLSAGAIRRTGAFYVDGWLRSTESDARTLPSSTWWNWSAPSFAPSTAAGSPIPSQTYSLKLATTYLGAWAGIGYEVGSFAPNTAVRVGRRYALLLAVKFLAGPSTPGQNHKWEIFFGYNSGDGSFLEIPNTNDANFGTPEVGTWFWIVLPWRPTRVYIPSEVGFRVTRSYYGSTGNSDIYIGYAQIYEISQHDPLRVVHIPPYESNYAPTNVPVTGSNIESQSTEETVDDWPRIHLYRNQFLIDGWKHGISAYHQPVPNKTQLTLWAEHQPSDLATDGILIAAGADNLGLRISEKDATTLQITPDSTAHDVEFAQRTAARRFKFVHSDGGVAIPALGMLPQYSSAPASPIEGQSYYDTSSHKNRTWDGTAWQDWW